MAVATAINGVAPPEVPLTDIAMGSWEFWALDDDLRDGAFATLRREAPISFWPAVVLPGHVQGAGHWALTRFDDVWFASRHPEIFSSRPAVGMDDLPPEVAELFGSIIVMDDPRHQRLRAIVSKAFTPRVLARLEESVRERARRLVAALVGDHPDGKADLVSELSGPLPQQVICDMMGIPEEDHPKVSQWTDVILGSGDPDVAADYDAFASAATQICAYGIALADDRRGNRRDDLTTSLVHAEVNGERLTRAEIASFFLLLAVAGVETTRNAISHGVLALTRYPEERHKWWADFDGLAASATEEIVRWSSPVIYMRRTLTRDIVLRGTPMAAGDKVTMWYCSANRDESKFVNPWMFDVTRDPNPHVGYGAGGVHFCLGANLARREIRVMFEELHRQVPDISASEAPTRLLSPFIHGIKSLPVAWTPPR